MWEVENSTCGTCGHPVDECRVHGRDWYPQRVIDYAEMERAAATASYEALHQAAPFHDGTFTSWSKERGPLFPFHFMDGVQIVVTSVDVNPRDHFTTVANADPLSVDEGVDESAGENQERDES